MTTQEIKDFKFKMAVEKQESNVKIYIQIDDEEGVEYFGDKLEKLGLKKGVSYSFNTWDDVEEEGVEDSPNIFTAEIDLHCENVSVSKLKEFMKEFNQI